MRVVKIFLPFALLSLFSLCPFLPKGPLQDPTATVASETLPPTEEYIIPTPVIETGTATMTEVPPSPTPTTPEILPSFTNEPLIPANLQEITAENIQDLAVVAEIPYHQLSQIILSTH